ncbi:hypothetical protein ACOMHN_051728 [Nucella lapillus]
MPLLHTYLNDTLTGKDLTLNLTLNLNTNLTPFPNLVSSSLNPNLSPNLVTFSLSPNLVLPVAKPWTAALVIEYIIRNVLSVLMVLINLLVLVTLGGSRSRSLRTAANLVIGSLAVTDLLVGLLGPAGLLIELEVVISPLMCRMGYAAVLAFGSVSINHLVFVSVDR